MSRYSNEMNLIIQSACTAALLMDLSLNSTEFINSSFFSTMQSSFPGVKQFFLDGGVQVGNQGTMLISLYALLVIPKELIFDQYKSEYRIIDQSIPFLSQGEIIDTYKTKGEYLRHIRNAVSHGRVVFNDSNPNNILVTFSDNYKQSAEFSISFEISKIPELILRLLGIHKKIAEELNCRNNISN